MKTVGDGEIYKDVTKNVKDVTKNVEECIVTVGNGERKAAEENAKETENRSAN